mmetsp:Transcript_16300/g.18455  ORF Transcript_16300/g.18455 Transcript_16300/m.18455 type:complete len:451 (+) Transcript_16300:135-1487(+)
MHNNLAAALPTWLQVFDPASGRLYYHNAQTGISQWEPPNFQPQLSPVSGQQLPLSVPYYPNHEKMCYPSHSQTWFQGGLNQNPCTYQNSSSGDMTTLNPYFSHPPLYQNAISSNLCHKKEPVRCVEETLVRDPEQENSTSKEACLEEPENRRCWGRPNRRRSVERNDVNSSDGRSESEQTASPSSRFRSTSSLDPKSIMFLTGYFEQACSTADKESSEDNSLRIQTEQPSCTKEEEKTKSPLTPRSRAYTTNTFRVASTIAKPNPEKEMRCVSAVLNAHMVSFSQDCVNYLESDQAKVFNDSTKAAVNTLNDHGKTLIPSVETVFIFIKKVFESAEMVEECIIMSLVYLERLLMASKDNLILHSGNWQPIVLTCMVLASKVWDDLSMQNGDFSKICPSYSLKRINELEVTLLEMIEYNVRIPSSTYAKYYFQLRDIGIELGIYSDEGARK